MLYVSIEIKKKRPNEYDENIFIPKWELVKLILLPLALMLTGNIIVINSKCDRLEIMIIACLIAITGKNFFFFQTKYVHEWL